MVATLLQLGVAEGAWVLPAIAAVAGAAAALPVRRAPPDTLRWDGARWWWQRSGESLAISPLVLIDLEQWMLLRLDPADDAGPPGVRRTPSRWIALSRRALGAQWTPLRLHLFLARG